MKTTAVAMLMAQENTRENVHGTATPKTKPSDERAEQRAANELVKLIRKLRWMRMEEEAKKAENQLLLCNVPAADSVVARSRETD